MSDQSPEPYDVRLDAYLSRIQPDCGTGRMCHEQSFAPSQIGAFVRANLLALEKHPDKTFIGRIERGFDFLGYHFSRAGLTVSKKTIANFIEKASRLYEQERRTVSAASPLEIYVRRWLRWANLAIF